MCVWVCSIGVLLQKYSGSVKHQTHNKYVSTLCANLQESPTTGCECVWPVSQLALFILAFMLLPCCPPYTILIAWTQFITALLMFTHLFTRYVFLQKEKTINGHFVTGIAMCITVWDVQLDMSATGGKTPICQRCFRPVEYHQTFSDLNRSELQKPLHGTHAAPLIVCVFIHSHTVGTEINLDAALERAKRATQLMLGGNRVSHRSINVSDSAISRVDSTPTMKARTIHLTHSHTPFGLQRTPSLSSSLSIGPDDYLMLSRSQSIVDLAVHKHNTEVTSSSTVTFSTTDESTACTPNSYFFKFCSCLFLLLVRLS